QCNAFDFRWSSKSQYGLARAMGADPVVLPTFFRNLISRVDHPQCSFVPLRLSRRPALSFLDDLARVDLQEHEESAESGGENPTHIPAPLPGCRGLRLLQGQEPRSMPLRG